MARRPVVLKELREIVDPAHTCLVAWDCQNTLVDMIFNKDQFVQNTKTLLDAARRNGVLIVYTKITPLPSALESGWAVFRQMRMQGVDDPSKLKPRFVPGTPGAEINAELAPKEGDVVLNKHTSSVFIGTYFETMMRNAGVRTLLFTGIATEIGVASSARDASNRGFYPVVVSDCCSSGDKQSHEATLTVLQKRVCLVVSSTEVQSYWK